MYKRQGLTLPDMPPAAGNWRADMLHLGDITKIHGGEAPVVDVVIGGSPCQDLSIAGKRAGLAGARSGLYME